MGWGVVKQYIWYCAVQQQQQGTHGNVSSAALSGAGVKIRER